MGEAKRRGTFEQRREQAKTMGQKIQMGQPIHIDLSKCDDIICGTALKDQPIKQTGIEPCACIDFIKTFRFKKLSALVSPTGKEQVVELQILKCVSCGAIKVIKP